jgi:hypothetical protein
MTLLSKKSTISEFLSKRGILNWVSEEPGLSLSGRIHKKFTASPTSSLRPTGNCLIERESDADLT